jgi:hypothetical protein
MEPLLQNTPCSSCPNDSYISPFLPRTLIAIIQMSMIHWAILDFHLFVAFDGVLVAANLNFLVIRQPG